jgi:phosphopantothenoylcysteine decarboxylase / phosphopantothenate---cysteine ligase
MMLKQDPLKGKKILLGVTGSIAAYKAILLLRRLTQAGAEVTVVMTASAQRFVTPLTFEALSGQKVHTDLFAGADAIRHLLLAEESDLILIAPATANILGKVANGVADDLLTTILLATRTPVVIAPAMDGEMWEHPVLQRNVSILEGMGCRIVPPEEGPLASGKEAVGRLATEEAILSAAVERIARKQDMIGERVLVTAGPTREPLDPVRYISNRSSGKMGYAIARAAIDRGARVILISGPTSLVAPSQARLLRVETTEEMRHAVLQMVQESTVVVMAAAVSDYRPIGIQSKKIRRQGNSIRLDLEPTLDILTEAASQKMTMGDRRILVGFAAESGDPVPQARIKLKQKGLDLIVANDIALEGAGFDSDTNIVTLLDRNGRTESLARLPKLQVAEHILNRVCELLRQNPESLPNKIRIQEQT